jgi:hypothetical protein
LDNYIELMLEDTPVKVAPENVIRVLSANQEVALVTLGNCSAKEMLDFLMGLQVEALHMEREPLSKEIHP